MQGSHHCAQQPCANLAGVNAIAQIVAESPVGKHSCNFGKKQQMLVGGFVRNKKNNHVGNRLPIGRIEGDRHLRSDECGDRVSQSAHARMRDGDPAAKSSGSDLFAFDEARMHCLFG